VGAKDDNRRGNVREQTRLKSTVAQEPSGSYAYHDESRVESVRGPRASLPGGAPDNDAHAPANKGRFAKSTMVGGFGAPVISERPASSEPAARAPRAPLSEPPEIGSWPPLPNVPAELSGAASEDEERPMPASSKAPRRAVDVEPSFAMDDDDLAPTDPPQALRPSAVGGAIWEVASAGVGTSDAPEGADPLADGADLAREAETKWSPMASPSEPAPADEEVGSERSRSSGPTHHEAGDVMATQPAARAEDVRTADLVGERMSTSINDYKERDLAKLEQLVERGAWEQIAHDLDHGARDRHPSITLLHVIAKRETLPADDKGAGKLTQEAIHALADLLGVPHSSPTALMLAKRLLRRNPVWTNTQPATGLSFGIILFGLAAGAGLGWLATRVFL
jgi:hypothetical protein